MRTWILCSHVHMQKRGFVSIVAKQTGTFRQIHIQNSRRTHSHQNMFIWTYPSYGIERISHISRRSFIRQNVLIVFVHIFDQIRSFVTYSIASKKFQFQFLNRIFRRCFQFVIFMHLRIIWHVFFYFDSDVLHCKYIMLIFDIFAICNKQ